MNWTPAKVNGFIRGAIRSGFRRWPPKYEALSAAFVGKKINKKTGREAKHYRCAKCRKHHVAADVQVDHTDPVVCPKEGFKDWDTYIERMFCGVEKLQVLCKPCHKKKTAAEQKVRRKK